MRGRPTRMGRAAECVFDSPASAHRVCGPAFYGSLAPLVSCWVSALAPRARKALFAPYRSACFDEVRCALLARVRLYAENVAQGTSIRVATCRSRASFYFVMTIHVHVQRPALCWHAPWAECSLHSQVRTEVHPG
jgi:hypothetical protein